MDADVERAFLSDPDLLRGVLPASWRSSCLLRIVVTSLAPGLEGFVTSIT